jgi:hypothetical protein
MNHNSPNRSPLDHSTRGVLGLPSAGGERPDDRFKGLPLLELGHIDHMMAHLTVFAEATQIVYCLGLIFTLTVDIEGTVQF